MNRDQLGHAIRAACQIIEGEAGAAAEAVIVVGSQAILGSFSEDELPPEATMSKEVDILPLAATAAETDRLADLLDGTAGQDSRFKDTFGFYLDGVGLQTSILPRGWRDRLVEVQNENTTGPGGRPQYIGWCLDPVDACIAKLCAFREKDRSYVAALLDAGMVDVGLIVERLPEVPPEHLRTIDAAFAFLAPWERRAGR